MTARMHDRRAGKSFRSFLTDDDGAVTVEFLIMIPLFTTFLLLATDASILFLRQTTLMDVARDTARAVARHAMTEAEGKAYAERAAGSGLGPATATVTIQNGAVSVLVTTDAQSAAPFGIVRFAVGNQITGRATNTMEPI